MSTNRLAKENSPYLLQHQNNPVDWYPWGDEAFARATATDKPIFLSIGYATCHWCHVMERESFEDRGVAAALNEVFVPVKVDREERPDVDQIYMEACQLAGGRCGWPLTVMLTPDRKPFFVATYLPRESAHGRLGMIDLIPRVGQLWQTERDRIDGSADELTARMRSLAVGAAPESSTDVSHAVLESLVSRFDEEWGGFGSSPKFPAAHNLLFLIEYSERTNDDDALHMALRTLDGIAAGGVYDHVGFGVHRYSTDRSWTLPHFEKMLYDQALFCMACTEAGLTSGEPRYLNIAGEIAGYVRRVLTSPAGGFYCAEDADTDGEEGLFYTWTRAELAQVLPDDLFAAVEVAFSISEEGNFRDEATGMRTKRNVLRRVLQQHGVSDEPNVDAALTILFKEREKREKPFKDDKILTDWNGLMIAALARLGTVLGDHSYVDQAVQAGTWLRRTMIDSGGTGAGPGGHRKLFHRYRSGATGITGMLDDYAYFSWGCFEIFQATGDLDWLELSADLVSDQVERFADGQGGGFFFSDRAATDLLHRPKEFTDGAMPSGNAVSALNCARLYHVTGDVKYRQVADEVIRAGSGLVDRYPSAFGGLAFAAEILRGPSVEVVVVGNSDDAEMQSMLALARRCRSRRCVAISHTPENRERLAMIAPFTAEMTMRDNRATAYVCHAGACDLPVVGLDALRSSLVSKLPADSNPRR